MDKFQLKEILEDNVATVVFTKVNGEQREMNCTLLAEYVPAKSEPTLLQESAESNDVIRVWDVDKNGWRSFHLGSVEYVHVKLK